MSQIKDIPINEIIAEGDYDDAVNLGMQVQNDMDKGRWVIGDLALALTDASKYGDGASDEFAKDIQIKKATVYKYRRMSKYWVAEWRDYVADNFTVSYSMMDTARRGKDIEESIDFLNYCQNENITTADDCARVASERWGKDSDKPKKLMRINNAVCTRAEDGKLTFHIDNVHPDSIAEFEIGTTYIIDVFSQGEI